MTRLDGTIFGDAEKLQEHLAAQGLRPYDDFEILTATIADGALEIDPCGRLEILGPHLDSFAATFGYWVFPFDPVNGTVSLIRIDSVELDEICEGEPCEG
ncbi:MAG TPA: hypothetical protein VK116_04715 [Planctomycetota bacterium]|nr:hypothetical protein [Planctomycetota bacterium]